MNATARFYAGFVLALAAVIAVSFALGYRAGSAAHRTASGANSPRVSH